MNRILYLTLSLLLTLALLPLAAAAQDIKLPPPQKTGGMALLEALAARSTSRSFDGRELSMGQISSLLWASFGVNRPDGKRTAPSALNKQEIDIYVLLQKGAYLYNAPSNELKLVAPKNLLKLGGTQDFITNAPLHILLVADLSKMAGTNQVFKLNTAYCDSGYISQNAYLFCTSAGLATGARMSFDQKRLAEALNLRSDQVVLLAHSVGYPE